MCKKSKEEAKILKDRTKGLDARGNVGVNTQAESRWAVDTLSGLDGTSTDLLAKDLEEIHEATKDDTFFGQKFHQGYVKFFGEGENKKDPEPKDMVKLLLEGEYNFKGAVDAMNRDQKAQTELYDKCRGQPEFKKRGRIEGSKRRNSFSNPHAGITDHVFREKETEEFFDKNVVHAKGMLEGDPTSETYKKFQEQGAPFIGGVSGTMQALVMRWEMDKPLDEIVDLAEKKKTQDEREKLIGIHMATLLAGGHHSASELLFSAKTYGYFDKVANPLENYPKAMKDLGERFTALGLPGNLAPKLSKIWEDAQDAVRAGLNNLKDAYAKTYKDPELGLIVSAHDKNVTEKLDKVFNDDLGDKLDEIMDQDDPTERKKLIKTAKELMEGLKAEAGKAFIAELDSNPFVKLSLRDTILLALSKLEGIK